MEKKKILFISQEITPYLPENEMSYIGRYLPQGIQESGKEIRAFMPRFGLINERRNQLHEVIRLSGMNIIIEDTDHSLIIKVASIQSARMQVYFIDNEDYFQRKATTFDKKGHFFPDNDERMIFYCRGVIETVKKLRWSPDIIHCHGWFSSLVPLYIKKAYNVDPLFAHTKVIYSIYNDSFSDEFNPSFKERLKIEKISENDLSMLDKSNYFGISKLAMDYSDAITMGSPVISPELELYANQTGKPFLPYYNKEEYIPSFSDLYDKMLDEGNQS